MTGDDEIAQTPLGAGGCGCVAGKSMLPTLWPGDLIWIERVDPQTLGIGDVIVFRLHSRCCVHRIQEVGSGRDGAKVFVTRGDARGQADPPVLEKQVLGKGAGVVRGKREISNVIERPLWNRGVGAALSRFEPMASLASRLIDEKMAWKKRRGSSTRLQADAQTSSKHST
jgi:signal peptidase I